MAFCFLVVRACRVGEKTKDLESDIKGFSCSIMLVETNMKSYLGILTTHTTWVIAKREVLGES